MAISKGTSKIVYKANVSKKKVKFKINKVKECANDLKTTIAQIAKCYDAIKSEYDKALKNCGAGFLPIDRAMDPNGDFAKKITTVSKKAAERVNWCKERQTRINKTIVNERDAQYSALQKKYKILEARVAQIEKVQAND